MDVSPIDEMIIEEYNERVTYIQSCRQKDQMLKNKNKHAPKQPIPKSLPPLNKPDNNLPEPRLPSLNKRQENEEYIPTNQSNEYKRTDNSQNRDSKTSKKNKKSKKHTEEEIQEGEKLGQYQISKH